MHLIESEVYSTFFRQNIRSISVQNNEVTYKRPLKYTEFIFMLVHTMGK
jgi:hypothetical protein